MLNTILRLESWVMTALAEVLGKGMTALFLMEFLGH